MTHLDDFRQRLATAACSVLQLAFLLALLPHLQAQGTLKWSFDTGGAINSAPAIGEENVIYVGSNDDSLYAINPDGTLKWSVDIGNDIRQPPMIAPDGTIYVGDHQGGVIAFNVDGTEKWRFNSGIGSGVTCEMALASDGTIYAAIGGALDARVYAINPDGTQFWVYDPDTTIRGITVGPEGTVCLADANGGIYLLDSLGALKWNVDYTNGINDPAIFGEDGTIYWVSNSEVGALNPEDGSLKWEVSMGDIGNSISIGLNGDLYVPLATSASVGGLAALDPADGSQKWILVLGARVETAPLLGLDGTIYIGCDDDSLYAVNPDGTQKWSFATGGDIISSPTIAENGTLYVGSNDSMLYALNTQSFGLSPSAWPKGQKDVQNTGRSGEDDRVVRYFAPHTYSLDEINHGIVTVRHTGGLGGILAGVTGTTATFRLDVRDRDGSLLFSIEDSVEPGATKNIVLDPPGGGIYQGSVVLEAPIKDGLSLAPFLTWQLNTPAFPQPLQIGAFFSDPADAAQVHHFPAEASDTKGLGIAVQNIGENQISCDLRFLNADGTDAGEELLDLNPLGSFVDFFNDSVPPDFVGSATFICDAPVVAVAVIQDFANGGFPTDRVTIKGVN